MSKNKGNVRLFLESSKELLEIPMSPMIKNVDGSYKAYTVEGVDLIQRPHKGMSLSTYEELIMKNGTPEKRYELFRRKTLNLKPRRI